MGNLFVPGVNSLSEVKPELASEWHPRKNGSLSPDDLMAGSGKRVWWQCRNNHEWQAVISQRSRGRGCPICSGKLVLHGFNDLATTNPELAEQWHPSRNGELLPQDLLIGSHVKVWWQCSFNHEWQVAPQSRSHGSGCPFCSGTAVLAGFNDLATTNPELAKQWHPSKNGDLTPRAVIAGTNKKIWWLCSKGHEWPASGYNRLNGTGCPLCSGRDAIEGTNDLATTNPELAKQWHPSKNGDLTPRAVIAGTNKKIWWVCSEGHEWKAAGATRLRSGCPICTGRQIQVGFNDLATTNPELAKQWHPSKNGDLTPLEVIAGSNKKVWWECEQKHEWQTAVTQRAYNGTGCPACATFGFDPNRPAILYFISSAGLMARKIGITNQGTKRLEDFRRAGWSPVHLELNEDGAFIRKLEVAMFEWIRKELRLPHYLGPNEMQGTGGWTETFGYEGPSDSKVIEQIKIEIEKIAKD